ncbi:prepilin-type N-terminal cleavage/methylation domain-containing protein [bacterium]|nr:prepilin-type N-terminal cleavage/methylation domain-containing protein [bacterium]
MSGRARPGFSFLELIVVIMIMGLMAAVVVVSIRPASSSKIRKGFVRDLNSLAYSARLAALKSNQAHRVYFQFVDKTIKIQSVNKAKSELESVKYTALLSSRPELVNIPEQASFDAFFVEGKNEMGAAQLKDAWFFITGQGLAQEVVLHVRDEAAKTEHKRYSLVLNPFSAQFELFQGFVKP